MASGAGDERDRMGGQGRKEKITNQDTREEGRGEKKVGEGSKSGAARSQRGGAERMMNNKAEERGLVLDYILRQKRKKERRERCETSQCLIKEDCVHFIASFL